MPPSPVRSLPVRLAWCLCLALAALGCERVAPGPDACRALTESWLDMTHEEALRDAAAFNDFRSMMERCLTQPFDRQLVDCVTSGQNKNGCRARFRQREEKRLQARLSE